MARTTVVVVLVMCAGAVAASAQESSPAPAGQATLASASRDGFPARMTLADLIDAPDQDKAAQDKPKTLEDKFEDLRKALPFDLHGGAYLFYYQPLSNSLGAKNNFTLYAAWLTLDASADDFAFHWEERFRDTPLRAFFQSNIWTQEIYGSWKTPEIPGFGSLGTIKMGKIYTRFGYFWDDSFYGAVQYFDGFKLDPEYGFSFENTHKCCDTFELNYAIQFFITDGSTNGSAGGGPAPAPVSRDTISDLTDGGRRRNDFVARVAPTYHVNEDLAVTAGASVQAFQADFTGSALDGSVCRWALEAELKWKSLVLFGEYDRQRGSPVPADATGGPYQSRHDAYWWTGARYTWSFITVRYSASAGSYQDTQYRELLQDVGLVFALQKHASLWFEYVSWRSKQVATWATIDNSLNIVLDLHF